MADFHRELQHARQEIAALRKDMHDFSLSARDTAVRIEAVQENRAAIVRQDKAVDGLREKFAEMQGAIKVFKYLAAAGGGAGLASGGLELLSILGGG